MTVIHAKFRPDPPADEFVAMVELSDAFEAVCDPLEVLDDVTAWRNFEKAADRFVAAWQSRHD